jgi:hypothetical protein
LLRVNMIIFFWFIRFFGLSYLSILSLSSLPLILAKGLYISIRSKDDNG